MTKFTETSPTDLKSSEWTLRAQFFPPPQRGQPRQWDRWQIVNAILYVTRTGCQWRMRPQDWPPWQTGDGDFRRWTWPGLWGPSNARWVEPVRPQAGRPPQPRAAVFDSPRVNPSEGGEARGVAVHTPTPGRKRHMVVDPVGLLLLVWGHRASLPDGLGGQPTLPRLFDRLKRNVPNRWCRLKRIGADGASRHSGDAVRQPFGGRLEIVLRSDDGKGFQSLPHRWVVEPTVGGLGRYRRLSRDFEHTCLAREAMTYIASVRRMLKLATK